MDAHGFENETIVKTSILTTDEPLMTLGKTTKSSSNAPTRTKKSVKRRKSDYLWLAAFLVVYILIGEYFFPNRSSELERQHIVTACNPFQLHSPLAIWATWTSINITGLFVIVTAMWEMMRRLNPVATTNKHFKIQWKTIQINFVLISLAQCGWDFLSAKYSITKTFHKNVDPMIIVRDMALWISCFELSWYAQHRAMHDVKFLWDYGHSFHHTWRKPEHMIGITAFALGHVVEIWVSMSSSFLGYLIFPINFYLGKIISLIYMILAVLEHWDGFDGSRYHINHHYLVTINYGTFVPIFDIFFGTYLWDNYEHPDSYRHEKNMKKE